MKFAIFAEVFLRCGKNGVGCGLSVTEVCLNCVADNGVRAGEGFAEGFGAFARGF